MERLLKKMVEASGEKDFAAALRMVRLHWDSIQAFRAKNKAGKWSKRDLADHEVLVAALDAELPQLQTAWESWKASM